MHLTIEGGELGSDAMDGSPLSVSSSSFSPVSAGSAAVLSCSSSSAWRRSEGQNRRMSRWMVMLDSSMT